MLRLFPPPDKPEHCDWHPAAGEAELAGLGSEVSAGHSLGGKDPAGGSSIGAGGEESSAGILKIVQGVPVLPGDLAAVLALPPPVRSLQGRKRKFGDDPRQQQQQDKMTAGQREGEGEGEGEVLRCAACTTSNTPEWRRGAGGVRLCNACGLQWLRVVREARAAGGSARQP
eukprot:TRINITY_DN1568_c2_g2_i3.p1 TRINITY_DN1568_c2_g2~~TRINITY_DN1568_c2_g2_i3.p1  ORF type:complete len:171 (+),score=42.10 TRINITY_DN1568_c2_g2_i3:854-1366(+)